MEEFMEAMIPISAFAATAVIIYFIVRARHAEKMELIKTGNISSLNRLNTQSPPNPGWFALFVGMILVAIGVAGIIGLYWADLDKGAVMGFIICLGLGAAGIVYYYMLAPLREKALKAYEAQLAILEQEAREASIADNQEEPNMM